MAQKLLNNIYFQQNYKHTEISNGTGCLIDGFYYRGGLFFSRKASLIHSGRYNNDQAESNDGGKAQKKPEKIFVKIIVQIIV